MDRIAELLCWILARYKWTKIGIVRLIAVRAPVTFHLACIGVQDRNTFVSIAVSDIGFVRFRIDGDFCDAAEIDRTVAVGVRARRSEFGKERTIAREFQYVRVAAGITTDPNIVFVIDRDAMI